MLQWRKIIPAISIKSIPSISKMMALCKKENEKEWIEVCDKVEEYGKECKEEGKQEGKKEMLFGLVAKNRLTMQEGAEELNVSLPEFKRAYDEYLKSK